jgi:hypothetical protein
VKIRLEPTTAGKPKAIVVELGEQFKDGLELYAQVRDPKGALGLLRVGFGPEHARAYRLTPPASALDLPDEARFDLALLDGRGCERCVRDQWFWELQRHDPQVEAYLR